MALYKDVSVGVPSKDQVARGVDESYTPKYDAGTLGFEDWFYNGLGKETRSYASGGGKSASENIGWEVNPGTTSGDNAGLRIHDGYPLQQLGKQIVQIMFYIHGSDEATPLTDEFEVGYTDDLVNGNRGAHLDLTDEQYQVGGAGGSTAPAPTVQPNETTLLTIVQDQGQNRTIFRMHRAGELVDETIINDHRNPNQGIVNAQSNGGGNRLHFHWVRATHDPEGQI